jgi:hypothetical protein
MPKSRTNMKSEHYVEEAVVQLLALKLRSGNSLSEVEAFAKRCLAKASGATNESPIYRGLDIHRLGSVLRTWHRESKYLTFDGLPRALPLEGTGGLKALVRKYYPSEKFVTVFKRLVETNLIKKSGDGAWLPASRTARISQLSHETLEHLSEGVARYVETVTKNVTAQKEQDVLFERSCKVTRLPASEFSAFRNYVNQQALAFLTAVDDWLEGRNSRVKKRQGRLCTAGVYTFAYLTGKGDPRVNTSD